MRRVLILAAALLAAASVPAVASFPRRAELRKYSHLYRAVRLKDGARAPGRNIRRYGVNEKAGPRRATAHELAVSIRRLRALLIPMLAPAAPRPAPAFVATARAPAGGTLAAIRACESGGNYGTDTGNGFYGAYQFTLSTWESVGGAGNPADASPAEQDRRAAILYAREGSAPWPVCGR